RRYPLQHHSLFRPQGSRPRKCALAAYCAKRLARLDTDPLQYRAWTGYHRSQEWLWPRCRLSSRDRTLNSTVTVTVGGMGRHGECVAEIQGETVYVPYALPGEVVRISRAGNRGVPEQIVSPSPA